MDNRAIVKDDTEAMTENDAMTEIRTNTNAVVLIHPVWMTMLKNRSMTDQVAKTAIENAVVDFPIPIAKTKEDLEVEAVISVEETGVVEAVMAGLDHSRPVKDREVAVTVEDADRIVIRIIMEVVEEDHLDEIIEIE